MSIHSTSILASSSRTERVLAIVALGLLAAQASLGVGAPIGAPAVVVVLGAVVVAALALRIDVPAARPITTLVALLAFAAVLPVPWQAMMALALGAFVLVARRVPSVAPPTEFRARGRVLVGWAALVGGVTPIALVGWLALLHPDLSDVRAFVPDVPFVVLVVGAIVFAIVNATLEEVIWRGVVQSTLTPLFGATAAIVLQAVSFGCQHAHGIPRGPVGMLLAGTWAVMLGVLRRRSGGLLAPTIAHVVADATIAVLVLRELRP